MMAKALNTQVNTHTIKLIQKQIISNKPVRVKNNFYLLFFLQVCQDESKHQVTVQQTHDKVNHRLHTQS